MEGIIRLTKDKDIKAEGDVVFHLDEPQATLDSWYAIEINNMNNYPVYTGIIAYDTTRQGYSRYYTPLLPGNNLVAFDLRGFVDSEYLCDLSQIWLRLYDSNLPDGALFKVGKLITFNDYKSYYTYIMKSSYRIPPQ